jgi:hypothetical protein
MTKGQRCPLVPLLNHKIPTDYENLLQRERCPGAAVVARRRRGMALDDHLSIRGERRESALDANPIAGDAADREAHCSNHCELG